MGLGTPPLKKREIKLLFSFVAGSTNTDSTNMPEYSELCKKRRWTAFLGMTFVHYNRDKPFCDILPYVTLFVILRDICW